MPTISFALLREGSSDDGLLVLLRELVVLSGDNISAVGDSRPYTGTPEAKLRTLLSEGLSLDLVFIHRDSDTRDPKPRHGEIQAAARTHGCPPPIVVSVVPVRMTETWTLCDEQAIRDVAGRPSSRIPLGIPGVNALERKANTKQLLRDALLTASETAGRRRQQFDKQFDTHRRTLLERIDVAGPIERLSGFQKLRRDIESAVSSRLACVEGP